MALIKCPECGKQISDKAPACPRCGLPMEKNIQVQVQLKQKNGRQLGGCLVFFLVLTMISQFIGMIYAVGYSNSLHQYFPNVPEGYGIIGGGAGILYLAACVGILNWKRWGVILYFVVAILMAGFSAAFLSIPVAVSGLIMPAIFMALIGPIWQKMDEAQPSGPVPVENGPDEEEVEPEKLARSVDPQKFGKLFCVNCGVKRKPGKKACPNCLEDYDS